MYISMVFIYGLGHGVHSSSVWILLSSFAHYFVFCFWVTRDLTLSFRYHCPGHNGVDYDTFFFINTSKNI